jgi:hypothetical protein
MALEYAGIRPSKALLSEAEVRIARGGVSGEFGWYLPEKLPLLLTPLTYIHVGNTGSRCRSNRLIPAYAYSELSLFLPKPQLIAIVL